MKLRSGNIDVRISTMPTQHGESVVMRLLNQNSGLLSLTALNLPPRAAQALQRAIARPSGMVLVTGPTGSGKTTTLYAALNTLNSTDRKIITVEDPVEYRLPGLNQVQVMEKIDLSFERVLRAALRQDPDVILVGEMRDQTTAEIGMRAALTGLNLPPTVAAAMQRAIARPSGMVLVTGPTGSGKTTTLYAALNELNSTDRKIITVEDPVEYRLPGLNQVQVMEKIDLSFDRVLRAALRQDPDVILVGEMRDQNTAEIGLRAALTGHLVLSTLHTNDAMSTPIRLLDMGVPKYMVALSLQLVLAQRLVRVICPHCAGAHQPQVHELAWLDSFGDPALLVGAQYRRGAGCAECNQTGYSGRTGVYEFIEMTQELIEAMNHGDPATFTQAARRQMKGQTLARDALRLVMAGRTTIEDAMRISNQVAEA